MIFRKHFFFGGEQFKVTGPGRWRDAELRLLSIALNNHQLVMGVEYQNSTPIALSCVSVRISVHAQDEWRIADTLSATAGLRYDYNNRTDNRLSPRGALIWQAMPKTTFKALYGYTHRSPNSYGRDFSSVAASGFVSSALYGKTADTTELVADYQPMINMNVRASTYYWDLQHILSVAPYPDGTNSLIHLHAPHRIITKGAELSVDKTWDWGARARGSFGIQDADQHHSHLPSSPYHLGELNFFIPISRMRNLCVDHKLQYYCKHKTVDASNTTGDYFLSNFNLMTDIRWIKGLEASLRIYNLFDENYQHPTTAPNWQNIFLQPDRTERLRMDYRF